MGRIAYCSPERESRRIGVEIPRTEVKAPDTNMQTPDKYQTLSNKFRAWPARSRGWLNWKLLTSVMAAAGLWGGSLKVSAGDMDMQLPQVGEHALNILSPTVLELYRVNTKDPDPGILDSWDWVNDQQVFTSPNMSSIRVVINGQTNHAAGV